MKKIISFSVVLCLLFSLAITAYAADEYIVSDETEIVDTGTTVYVDNDIVLAEGEDILTGVTVMSLSPVTPSDTSGLKAVLLELLGDYDPVIVEYAYQNTNNTYMSYLREVQPDYVWLCSAGLLVVVIYCLFKLGGAILCKR